MQVLCQISNKITKKANDAKIWVRLSDTKTSHADTRHVVESTEVRNSIINIQLHLMIFIRMHSQESQMSKHLPLLARLVYKSKLTGHGQV